MKLDLGGVETITDLSPEQVAHYLQYMPAESPFIILERSEGEFLQAIVEDGQYRIEYKEDEVQWFAIVEYEKAASVFLTYLSGSGTIYDMASWKKLSLASPATTKWIFIGVTLLLLGLLGLGIWIEIEQWLEIYR